MNDGVLWDIQLNTSYRSGGVNIAGGSAAFTYAAFRGNSSTVYGGGIAIDGGTVSFENGLFQQNWSAQGGGLNADGGATVTITSTLLVNNFTPGQATNGTAIVITGRAGVSVFGSEFSGNGVMLIPGGGSKYDPDQATIGSYLE